jgi:hypothetical protein
VLPAGFDRYWRSLGLYEPEKTWFFGPMNRPTYIAFPKPALAEPVPQKAAQQPWVDSDREEHPGLSVL